MTKHKMQMMPWIYYYMVAVVTGHTYWLTFSGKIEGNLVELSVGDVQVVGNNELKMACT